MDLEKRGNITIIFVANGDGQNCRILWWAFNCQFKSSSVFPRVADIPGYRFQMQSIQCNNGLDVVSVFVFFLGRSEDHDTINVDVRWRKVQHYKDIVIEYGHFRLKITGVSRLTLSQWESSPCIELYCSQLSMFSKS